MIVRHSIETEKAEADMLFELVSSICLAVYPSVEEQTLHVEAAKLTFKNALDEIVHHSFKIGQKVCSTADEKDTEMYKV